MSGCRNGTVPNETYTVRVRIPRPLRTRITETWNSLQSWCMCIVYTVVILSVFFLVYGLVWVLIYCQADPGMALETLSIRNMTVYQNSTTGAPQWQVDSALNVTLSTWNPNTVAGCYSTYRRVMVRVEYKGQTILRQEVPLGFGLKPRRSRSVAMELQGQDFPLTNADLGPFMEAELQSGNLTMDVFFDARFLRNDRKAGWLHFGCVVVASSPSNASSSLLQQLCYWT